VEEEELLDLTGLAIAEYYFGPLLSPIAATPAQWSAYIKHRANDISKKDNPSIVMSPRLKTNSTGLDDGMVRKCSSIMQRDVE
ncbi:hypothetical protein J3R83DRAFT_11141, partial [Lanmaoa asiatica]